MDVISVSLNAPTKEEYMAVTRPKYDNAFNLMCTFVRDCAAIGKAEVVVSIVDVIPQEQIDASRELAEKLGAKLRIRTFED
jgi:wyosine [tRNA(Phe)-imidazoG37] synthetase (radical SAM superfamily)